MSVQPPKIEQRSYAKIVADTEDLAHTFSGWSAQTPIDAPARDLGGALIRIFGRMAEVVIDRINRVPDQNFLAFLDLIGTRQLPPQPARVPLTFRLAAGSPEDAFVPAGTQVASPATEQLVEAIFETERDLVLTRAQLVTAYVREPAADLYGDVTARATGVEDAPFRAFEGDTRIEHSLYLAHDDIFGLPDLQRVTLTFALEGVADLQAAPLAWSYWNGSAWQPLAAIWTAVDQSNTTWRATLDKPPTPELVSIDRRTARWLRLDMPVLHLLLSPDRVLNFSVPDAERLVNLPTIRSYWDGAAWQPLTASASADVDDQQRERLKVYTDTLPTGASWLRAQFPLGPVAPLPNIRQITISATVAQADVAPEHALANAAPLDVGKDFYPFGERPRFNDALYLLLDPTFARPGATLTVKVELRNHAGAAASPVAAVQPRGVVIAWETWSDGRWQELGRTSPDATTPADVKSDTTKAAFVDGTKAFTHSGDITLTLGKSVVPQATSVGGTSGHWLRARIVAGDYGADARVEENPDYDSTKPNSKPYKLTAASYAPPLVSELRLGYRYEPQDVAPAACVTLNDFQYADCTDAARGAPGESFQPFAPTVDAGPTLYLGFDQPFANRPTTLYACVEPTLYGDAVDDERRAAPLRVVWEYASPAGWARLEARDETRAFAERGLISFVGPADFAPRAEFGRALFWLRARQVAGARRPRLRRLLTNTVWASQTTTLRDELLGSSDGSPDQVFRTAQVPMLHGQQVEVREREAVPAAELAVLRARTGPDAVTPIAGDDGRDAGFWVRWQEVPDFYASGPRDRHYIADHVAGEVHFGDGQHGMVPPLGSAVRATLYRTGGGLSGNRPATSITQLKTALPYVDGATNDEPAVGGADVEPLESVRERGPLALRNRDCAVTAQDYEDLAQAASPEVARVLAIPPANQPIDLATLNIFNVIADRAPETLFDKKSDTAAAAAFRSAAVLGAEQPPGHRLVTIGPFTQTDEQARKAEQDAIKAHNQIDAGSVVLVVVPQSDSPQPIPSLELLNRVEEHLLARCAAALDPARLQVIGPNWVRVTVSASVVPTSLAAAAALEATVAGALRRFLHPLTGGVDGSGWAFGRQPYKSDLYALIESLPGVDHVRALDMVTEPDSTQLPAPEQAHFLIYSGDHVVTLASPGEGA